MRRRKSIGRCDESGQGGGERGGAGLLEAAGGERADDARAAGGVRAGTRWVEKGKLDLFVDWQRSARLYAAGTLKATATRSSPTLLNLTIFVSCIFL